MTQHPTLLAQLAAELELHTHHAFARAFRKAGVELTNRTGDRRYAEEQVDDRRLRRWKAGKVATAHDIATGILEYMFQRPLAELFAPPDEFTAQPAPQLVIDEDELLMTAHEASNRAGDYASQRLSPSTLEQVQDDVIRLATTYSTTPPATIYLEARRLHAQAATLLDQTSVPRQIQDLHFASGLVAALLSQVSFDLGSRQACTELARAARMHGEVIDHAPLQAFADCTLALVATWEDQPERAIRIIQRAYTHQVGGTGAIRRASIAARAYARIGDEESARRELAIAAESNRDDRDDVHDGVGGEFSFSDERRLMSAGSSLLSLGDTRLAAEASGQALELLRSRPSERRSIKVLGEAAADQAHAHLIGGRLDAAVASLELVLTIPQERRVDGLVQRVRPVQRQLTRQPYGGDPTARDLAEQLEAFTTDSVPQLLGPTRPALP